MADLGAILLYIGLQLEARLTDFGHHLAGNVRNGVVARGGTGRRGYRTGIVIVVVVGCVLLVLILLLLLLSQLLLMAVIVIVLGCVVILFAAIASPCLAIDKFVK